MLVADLGTWLDIVRIKGKESELEIKKDWNTGKNGGEREIINNQTI